MTLGALMSGNGDPSHPGDGSEVNEEEEEVPGKGFEGEALDPVQNLGDASRRQTRESGRSLGGNLEEKLGQRMFEKNISEEPRSWPPYSVLNAVGVRIPPQLLTLGGGARRPEPDGCICEGGVGGTRDAQIPFHGEIGGGWIPRKGGGAGGAESGCRWNAAAAVGVLGKAVVDLVVAEELGEVGLERKMQHHSQLLLVGEDEHR
ncbi:hypothetical protein BT96DRAFT_946442 [Gymnopus androsaceus JB14]|uniref:Uncharacterized protein n=1 Tax=Gymnopus androsaceus JB14 TaxID=1447944 RepID=A0A6A4GYB1_9AGAR|nr:hypothetical protein BT96DRAFT_946442 [Gymnopus androsaceus JB14]